MSDTKTIIRYRPLSVLSILGIVFIILKLTNYITWSWVWVLAPFWIPPAILIGALCLFGLIYLIFIFICRNK